MCEDAGVKWLGPTPEQIIAFGLKHEARRLAGDAGVPLVPGTGSVGKRGSGNPRREGTSAIRSCSKAPPAAVGSA